jgi:tetratricopeptide (TPR) repeat protein
VLLTAIVTNRFWPALGIDREFGIGISGLRFSEDAIAFAERAGISGRPFNCLAMGGYLIWTRFPQDRVFVDGRLAAYPEALFRKYFNATDDPAAWPALVRQYDFDYAFLHHGSPNRQAMINGLMARYGWVLAYYDDTTSLLLPGDERHRAARERAAQTFEALERQRDAGRMKPSPSRWRVAVEEFERGRIAGDFLTVIGRHDEARAAYARAVASRPDSSEARFALASAEWRAGAHAEAEAGWREIQRRDPGYRLASDALADPARIVAETAPPR